MLLILATGCETTSSMPGSFDGGAGASCPADGACCPTLAPEVRVAEAACSPVEASLGPAHSAGRITCCARNRHQGIRTRKAIVYIGNELPCFASFTPPTFTLIALW